MLHNKLIDEYASVIQNEKDEHLNEVIFSLLRLSRGVYNRYMSQAARVCKDKSFKEKTKCMLAHRIEAVKREISSLKTSTLKCRDARNQSLCKARIDKKVLEREDQLKKDIKKLQDIKKKEEKKLYEYEHPTQTRPKPKNKFTGEQPKEPKILGVRGPSGLEVDLDDEENNT